MTGGELIASVGCPLVVRWIKALKEPTLFYMHWFQCQYGMKQRADNLKSYPLVVRLQFFAQNSWTDIPDINLHVMDSVHENHRTHRTFPMAGPKCLMRDFTNLNRIYKAHRTYVWWIMKVFQVHWWIKWTWTDEYRMINGLTHMVSVIYPFPQSVRAWQGL